MLDALNNELNQVYAENGRLNMLVKQKDAAFSAVLDFVAKIISGEIDPARVSVNLTDRVLSCVEEGQKAALPVQFNGLPKVVIAPSPSEREQLQQRIRELEAELLIQSSACSGNGTNPDPAPHSTDELP